jgi:hypothetical protein
MAGSVSGVMISVLDLPVRQVQGGRRGGVHDPYCWYGIGGNVGMGLVAMNGVWD